MVKMRLKVLFVSLGAAAVICAGLSTQAQALSHRAKPPASTRRAAAATLGSSASAKAKLSCWYSTSLCAEIANPQDFWGKWYVGHDEPSVLFYSNVPGSGNRMHYELTIPSDPSGPYSSSKTYNFELHPAFWFGMAMCDTQSYPEQVRTCAPDSDSNAVDVTTSTRHPGTAFMELQFYPPGWVPQFANSSCDATKWCAALTIDSLSEDPIRGTTLNTGCQAKILGGIEYVNFAYLTRSGVPQGPPNPLHFDPVRSGAPGPDVLYMNQGDNVTVDLHDSAHGLVTTVTDHTTGQSGSMTASAANGFGQIRYAPHGRQCKELPYDFHPMYSTSSPKTTVPWAAHTYNIAFADEIGHFDFCTSIDSTTGSCNGQEGMPGDQEPADGDDNICFDSSQSLLYPVTGCVDTNDPGFDGVPYQLNTWPDGSPNHPTPILFSSPRTVGDQPYSQAAFEADLPRIEASDLGGICDRTTGAGCVNPPTTDDGSPAPFYPYFSTVSNGPGGACSWGIGATLPNTISNFGGNSTAEFGSLHATNYYVFGGHGATAPRFNNFQQVLATNPC
jgi:hypothetical protein